MGGEFLDSSPQLPSYTDQFNEHFPYYLSIGMSYDQYWNMDCTLVKHYRKAHELKRNYKNQELWLQGLYIYDALCAVSPVLRAFAKPNTKPIPYPEKPYPLTRDEIKSNKEEEAKVNRTKAKAAFQAWATKWKPSK